MGVTGLWKLIESSGKPVPLETLENKILAIDISIWLHQVVKGFQDSKGGTLPNAHLLGLFHRLCKLLFYKIKPIFVFDGGVPYLKRETMMKRAQSKNKLLNEADRLQTLLLTNLAKEKVVQQALGSQAADILAKSPVKAVKAPLEKDDMFVLPPLKAAEEEQPSSSDNLDDSDFETKPHVNLNLHSIDVESSNFKTLPADIRHEILTDIKETRKQSSWGRLHELPAKGDDFSTFQMKRLLKRRKVQVSLEDAEKEMGGNCLSVQELEQMLAEEGVVAASSAATKRINSDDQTRFLMISSIKKAMEEAIQEEKTVKLTVESPQTNDLGSEYDLDVQKAIEMSLLEPKEDDLEENGEIKMSSAQKRQLTGVAHNLARAYMMEYAGMSHEDVDEILGKGQAEQQDLHESITQLLARNGILEESSLVKSDTDTDSDFEEVVDVDPISKPVKVIPVIFNPAAEIIPENDIFADVFRKPEKKATAQEKRKELLDILNELKMEKDRLLAAGPGRITLVKSTSKLPLNSITEEEETQDIVKSKDGKAEPSMKSFSSSNFLKPPAASTQPLMLMKTLSDQSQEEISKKIPEVEENPKNVKPVPIPPPNLIKEGTDDEPNISIKENQQEVNIPENLENIEKLENASCEPDNSYSKTESNLMHLEIIKIPSKTENSSDSNNLLQSSEDAEKTEERKPFDEISQSNIATESFEKEIRDKKSPLPINGPQSAVVDKDGALNSNDEINILTEQIDLTEAETISKNPDENGVSAPSTIDAVPVSSILEELARQKQSIAQITLDDPLKSPIIEISDSDSEVTPSKKMKLTEYFSVTPSKSPKTPMKDPEEHVVPNVTSPFFVRKTPKSSGKKSNSANVISTSTKAQQFLFGKEDTKAGELLVDEVKPIDTLEAASEALKAAKSKQEIREMAVEIRQEKLDLESERNKQTRFGSSITDQMSRECQQLLRLFGIPYIQAPMEAEAQCAFLNAINLTNGTITDDSDIWLFGGQTVYKNFFDQKKHVLEFRMENIEKLFNVDRKKLIQLAMLVGSDYTSGINGIGAVTGLEILAQFSSAPEAAGETNEYMSMMSGLRKFKEWWQHGKSTAQSRGILRNKLKNIAISEGFPKREVMEAYLYPQVDDNQSQFSWGVPDVETIIEFTKKNFGWTRSRTDELLLPVMKKIGEKRVQKSIKNYFNVSSPATLTGLKVSKRVEMAVKKMSSDYQSPNEEEKEKKKPANRKRKSVDKGKKTSPKKSTVAQANEDDSDCVVVEDVPEKVDQKKSVEKKKTTSRKAKAEVEDEPSTSKARKVKTPRIPNTTHSIPQKEKQQKLVNETKKKAIEIFKGKQAEK